MRTTPTLKRILAALLGWALALVPSVAWAQNPMPIYAANGQPIIIDNLVLGGGGGNTKTMVQYADFSMFNELEIRYYSTLNPGAFIPQGCAPGGTYIAIAQGVATSWTSVNTLGTTNAYKAILSEGNPAILKRYRVGGAVGPLTVVVKTTALAGWSCNIHVEVRGMVFPSPGVVNAEGAMTLARGLTIGTAEEALVGVAAGSMPTGSSARSITLQNTGPNAIFCGFSNTVTVANGVKIGTDQGATFDLAGAPDLYCITTVAQVAGAGTRVVLSDMADSVRLYGGGGAGGGGAVIAFAPNVPSTVSLSGSTSNFKCGLTAGVDYEVSCTVPWSWRHGAATPTALLTDNPMPAGAVRSPVRMPTGSTCFAFISTSAGSCTVAELPTE